MTKSECLARLNLLGIDVIEKEFEHVYIDKHKHKPRIFIFTYTKPYVGYIEWPNKDKMPSYFTTYKHMLHDALELIKSP